MTQASAPHATARALRARADFVAQRSGPEILARQRAIRALPTVQWKGRILYTLRCHGTSGKGPHDTNVPEGLLWALLDFRAFRCPYHVNDSLETR